MCAKHEPRDTRTRRSISRQTIPNQNPTQSTKHHIICCPNSFAQQTIAVGLGRFSLFVPSFSNTTRARTLSHLSLLSLSLSLLSLSQKGSTCFQGKRKEGCEWMQSSFNFPSCWANMPPELLRDVLMRIEASEDAWPDRKYVVACAGVCRSWREIMKEIVKSPQVSSKLTFPISLKQPGPRDSLLQCYIKRNRSNQTYYLFLGLNQASTDDGKFLLAARKCRRATHTDYIISLNRNDVSRGSSTYIGRLRSNFLCTKFTVYDAHPPICGAKVTKSRSTRLVSLKQVSPRVPAGNYPIAHVSYDLNVLGSRGPRIMQCVMDAIPASAVEPGGVAPTQTQFLHSRIETSPSIPFFRSESTRLENLPSVPLTCQNEGMLVLRNKSPRWHEQLQCWCLNFNGRVTVASVKNFQLVASPKNGVSEQAQENVILQFGKVGKDVFTMDYQYPISAFEAFAICLSSFDTKIACE